LIYTIDLLLPTCMDNWL